MHHRGIELHCHTTGSGDPLIILHGLFGSLDNWQPVAKKLGEAFRVFSVDQRNHGRSPHSGVFDYPAMAEDLRVFLDTRGLDSAHLLGHSMGGKTAMRFALDHPGRVRTLSVADIAPRAYDRHHDHILDALCALRLVAFSSRKEIDATLEPVLPSPAVRQFLLKNLRRKDDGSFEWKMNLPGIRRNYDNILAAIDAPSPSSTPALFLRGVKADYLTDADIPDVLRLFPRARVVDLDAGHWLHAEKPEEFVAAVVNFIAASRTAS